MTEALTPAEIGKLIAPFLEAGELEAPESIPGVLPVSEPEGLTAQLQTYLDLLLRWNSRTNLTAIRDPREIVQRHFGESLFAGVVLSRRLAPGATLLDVGSGGGFPGLPIQLLRPDLRVTLAESQGKKASFLREAVRSLGLKTEVFSARVETMPAGRLFDAVTLRAVDNMELAIRLASERIARPGWLAVLGESQSPDVSFRFPIPGRESSFLEITER
ncbi:16S rRNA m(7)G-527 methyltransferase [Bryocella elongata]|uniref:Ribosomal RNA small subunit methyltransferase G n=1 Tax=Bryocella elongata TaxID=863522 RepID=A0A1H5Y1F0_9BACT|nr:16S rRNA (guanine(527)-N(7))-methyltransferase RsmG [Bryocella elongata]SEG17497.1 16S rRNA m(7)G-527 methyltransferase [Bryocella elongata]